MRKPHPISDTELLERFVRTFEKREDLIVFEPVPPELEGGRDDSPWARQKWKPASISTDPSVLESVYRKLPGRFPPLYEQLVLSFRWLEVELDDIMRLLPNAAGPTPDGLLAGITSDPVLTHVLFPLGLIPFGKAPDVNYDPVCFDTTRRHSDGDCPIVRVEHESVLCHLRVGESWQVADSFRSLVEAVIGKA